MMEKAFGIVSREEIFRHTGLQFMQFNTLYQLLAMKLAGSPLLDIAETLLMMPDLFHWLLTGVKCNEMTEASTSQFYNPGQGRLGHRAAGAVLRCPRGSSARSPSRARRSGRCGRTWPPRPAWRGQGGAARLARHGQRRDGRARRTAVPASGPTGATSASAPGP